ncbi:MAG TPA: type II toxin-antitoxin system RelE/ParE family toxin [Terracidiphilus sp.]|nr:type II toxin-antitoxin system RelE/ParE family toxin [Terracidiphilus sp.]
MSPLKRYEVHFRAEAVEDLDALFCYIAEQSSLEIADGYLARIDRLCRSLASLPKRGTAVPGGVAGLRTMGSERRVTILFRVEDERVDILRILYGGRDLGPQIERLAEE